jgi:orotidine-5'-phosphate decarboxylase
VLTSRPDGIRNRLIFALDVDSLAEAEALVEQLAREVGVFKVGKQLFLSAGPEVVRMIQRHGADVFLDLKFHDIPYTVARAGIEAARLGVRFFDLHASGSFEMMERTQIEVARVCRREGVRRPKILAVTVLTEPPQERSPPRRRLRRGGAPGGAARAPGAQGRHGRGRRVAARDRAHPARVRARLPHRHARRAAAGLGADDDQKRYMTPEEAMKAGADYLVLGRPIRDAPDPLAAVREVVAEMARGFLTARTRPGLRS